MDLPTFENHYQVLTDKLDAKDNRIEELEKALREVRSSIVKSYTDVGLMTPWQAETARIVVSIDKALGDDS